MLSLRYGTSSDLGQSERLLPCTKGRVPHKNTAPFVHCAEEGSISSLKLSSSLVPLA